MVEKSVYLPDPDDYGRKGYIKLWVFGSFDTLFDQILPGELVGSPLFGSSDPMILRYSHFLSDSILNHHPTFGCVEFHVVTVTQNSEVLRVRAATSWTLLLLCLGAAFGKYGRSCRVSRRRFIPPCFCCMLASSCIECNIIGFG